MNDSPIPLRVSVIGCGYLGAVHAVAMAALGHDVTGVDIDPDRIALLQAGSAPFFEPQLPERLAAGLASGRLRFSTELADAADAELHFLCIGTPQADDGDEADLSSLFAATDSLLPFLRPGAVVAGKSTVPVGTAERLAPRITEAGGTLVWNPEFLREGRAVADSLGPDRIVIGSAGGPAAERGVGLLQSAYQELLAAGTPVVVTDLPTAELVKGAANAYLATRISFMNAMAEVAEQAGADVSGLAEALGHDARIGPHYLQAGIGFGGGCLPKDIRSFSARARELGALAPALLLDQVDEINLAQRSRVIDMVVEHFGGSALGRSVTVLGAAFKPESDDIRDSPALDIARGLLARGADVTVTDPAALPNVAALGTGLRLEPDTEEALRNAECVVLATDWAEYRGMDPAHVATLVAAQTVFDGRNCLDRAAWGAAGWSYRGMGRH